MTEIHGIIFDKNDFDKIDDMISVIKWLSGNLNEVGNRMGQQLVCSINSFKRAMQIHNEKISCDIAKKGEVK